MSLQTLLWDALEFAKKKHLGQKRKHGSPYIEHPLSAAIILAGWGYTDPELLAAAALHDVAEDCGVSFKCISRRYGDRVSQTVRLLTRDKAAEQKEEAGHTKYFELLLNDRWGCLIKLADRLDNLISLKHLNRQEQAEYCSKTRRDFLPFITGCAGCYPEDAVYWEHMEHAILSLLSEMDQDSEDN